LSDGSHNASNLLVQDHPMTLYAILSLLAHIVLYFLMGANK